MHLQYSAESMDCIICPFHLVIDVSYLFFRPQCILFPLNNIMDNNQDGRFGFIAKIREVLSVLYS